jgi:HEPN domain-containing protein
MPPERFGPDDPREWLRRADSNLVQARRNSPGICLEDLCFQAQQAAEKALKAILLARRERPAYTHDLAALLRLMEQSGQAVPDEMRRIVRLSDYAVETRYPGVFEPVTEQDYREALDLAARCVEWVRERLSEPKRDA